VCDEGYVGFDCASRALPPSPPPAFAPAPLELASATSPSSLRLNVTASCHLPSGRGGPLAMTLPPGSQTLLWGVEGAPPEALRLGPTDQGSSWRVDAAVPIAASAASLLARRPSTGQLGGAPLQAQELEEATAPPHRQIVGSAVDWRSSRAYVALSGGSAGCGASGGTCGGVIAQLALPTLATLAVATPPSVGGDAPISAIALASEAIDTAEPPAWLYLLRSPQPTVSELLSLRLPQMQLTHSLRFEVPSPAVAAHYEPRGGSLYVLSAHPAPRLIRLNMHDGQPVAPPGQADALPLPDWSGALPLLLPFPRSRQLVFFSAPPPAAAPGDDASFVLRVCRVAMRGDEPLSAGDDVNGCTQLRGQYAREVVTSAVADEPAGAAYVGCLSGALLRLRLSPLRVEAVLRPAEGASLVAAAFRPFDGSLWVASEAAVLYRISTRANDKVLASPSTPPAWFRWRLPSLQLGTSAAAVAKALQPSSPPPLSPPLPPPLPPQPPQDDEVWRPPSAATRPRFVWAYPRLGFWPSAILVLIGVYCGGMLGGRAYQLIRLCTQPRAPAAGLKALP
jgi:hypothetical protein